MDDLTAALMGTADADTAINRHVLKAAVMRQMICRSSGVVLDIRSAVLFTATYDDGDSQSEVMDGAAWDVIAPMLTARAAELAGALGFTLDVIDGRVINAGMRR